MNITQLKADWQALITTAIHIYVVNFLSQGK